MSIEITQQLVESVAQLSRLSLTPEELAEMHEHFDKVLRYVESLDRLDTDSIDPSIFPLETVNIVVADDEQPSLGVEQALKHAPAQRDGFFLVPRIIQESS